MTASAILALFIIKLIERSTVARQTETGVSRELFLNLVIYARVDYYHERTRENETIYR